MEVIFSGKAEEELDKMDRALKKLFLKHAGKVAESPQGRHMRFGLPFNVEDVTKQARMVYNAEKETCCVLHCFKTHKEYERWYKSFK